VNFLAALSFPELDNVAIFRSIVAFPTLWSCELMILSPVPAKSLLICSNPLLEISAEATLLSEDSNASDHSTPVNASHVFLVKDRNK